MKRREKNHGWNEERLSVFLRTEKKDGNWISGSWLGMG